MKSLIALFLLLSLNCTAQKMSVKKMSVSGGGTGTITPVGYVVGEEFKVCEINGTWCNYDSSNSNVADTTIKGYNFIGRGHRVPYIKGQIIIYPVQSPQNFFRKDEFHPM